MPEAVYIENRRVFSHRMVTAGKQIAVTHYLSESVVRIERDLRWRDRYFAITFDGTEIRRAGLEEIISRSVSRSHPNMLGRQLQ